MSKEIERDAHGIATIGADEPIALIDGQGAEYTFGQAVTVFEDTSYGFGFYVLRNDFSGEVVADGWNATHVAEEAVKLGLYWDSEF